LGKKIGFGMIYIEIFIGSFYGAVRKLTFLKKLILILMFDSNLNC